MDIVEELQSRIRSGTVIPKPAAKADFVVKGWGTRREEPALVYFIPNHKNKAKPYQKGITISEWHFAYNRLMDKGTFDRKWFDANMKQCAAEGGCNFTTIGGIFTLLGIAEYNGTDGYKRLG